MIRSYTTPKGSILPILNLRGKDYLEVKFRLVWFREEHPTWSLETELLAVNPDSAYARATVKDEHGRIIATSHKFEDKKGFPDFIEKCETGAIGRALALCGFGTQFCADELDEGERIVDSPVLQAHTTEDVTSIAKFDPQWEKRDSKPVLVPSDPGEYIVQVGKKYKGRRLATIPMKEIESYLEFLEDWAEKKSTPLSHEAASYKIAVARYKAFLKGGTR